MPPDVREAVAVWVLRTIKSADTGHSDATAMPELGTLIYNKAIPADVRRMLNRYERKVVPA